LYLNSMDTRVGPPTGPQEMLPRHYKTEGGSIADRGTRYLGGKVGNVPFDDGGMRFVVADTSWL